MVSNMLLNAEGSVTTWIFVALLVVLVVVLLVVPMFTNRKRAKQTTEIHNSLRPGDVVKTVGGIIGTIKEIRQVSPVDKEMVIETGDGDNKCTMVFDIQALYQVVSKADAPAATEVFDEQKPVETAENTVSDKSAETAEEKVEPVAEAKTDEVVAVADEPKVEEPVAEVKADADVAAEAEQAAPKAAPKTAKPKTASAPKKKPINSKNSTKK